MSSGRRRTRDPGTCVGCCCASIPWFQLICTGLVVAGLVIFFIKSGEALAAVTTLMTELNIAKAAQKVGAAAIQGTLGASVAAVLAVLVLTGIALLSSTAGNARRYRMQHGRAVNDGTKCGSVCQMGTSVVVVVLMWLLLAALVGLIAVWTAFLLGSVSGDHGAGFAMGTTDSLTAKLGKALKKVDGLFTKMRGAWNKLTSSVPSFLKNNSWFKELTTDIGGPILQGSQTTLNATCPDNCLDLGVFATLVQFEPRCVCSRELLTKIQTRLRVAWKGATWSLGALALVAIAGSWILMSQIADFVHARRDAKEASRIIADEEFEEEQEAEEAAKAAAAAAGRDVEMAAQDQGFRR